MSRFLIAQVKPNGSTFINLDHVVRMWANDEYQTVVELSTLETIEVENSLDDIHTELLRISL